MSFALGRKCYVRNLTVTKFCDIGTGDFRFRFSAEKGISFSSAFSFTAENEKMHFRSASTSNYFRLHPTSMILKHSTTPGSGQPVGASKN